jgi:multidrug transporter EmrE-like cation transporter
MTDAEFWTFLAVAMPALFLPVAITWWKGQGLVPVALLSLVFWPGALILALRLPHRLSEAHSQIEG